MNKFVLIERYDDTCFFWANMLKNKRITELSLETILYKYQGFEGELDFMSNLEEDAAFSNIIIDKYIKEKGPLNSIPLLVISGLDIGHSILDKETLYCGYDVGVCEEEKTIYSSIFNEILFG